MDLVLDSTTLCAVTACDHEVTMLTHTYRVSRFWRSFGGSIGSQRGVCVS